MGNFNISSVNNVKIVSMKSDTRHINTPCLGIFNDSFPPILDGVTLTVENYMRWFLKRGRPACVVTPWNPVGGEFPYEVIRYFSLPIHSRHPYRYGYPKLDPFIWRKIRTTPFLLAHSHCPFSSGRLAVYAKKRHNIPLIGTFHSKYKEDLKHSFKYMPWAVDIIMGRILDFFNACDEVWIPQAQVEETVREYGYKGPLTVVDNGIDYASISTDEIARTRDADRKRIGLADDEIGLLFVGQHIWEKGIGIIADALHLLGNDVKYRMNFIGTGYAENSLKKRIADYGLSDRVILRGVVTDREALRRYYAASDLFLFPSKYDNAPLVVREAASMLTPSVLVVGSTASEVITDGHNGYLVEHSPRAYADAIRCVAADPRSLKQVASNARSSLVRSWEDVVGEVSDRYDTIIKNYKG